ncbi:unnamed protein product [Ilex paraguariensis]|uniref:Uncharacterized protein n=1 Tax=Ilex paraguariensis TaxID=185542 RepID=A0ABC8S181_9AQUA
MAVEEKGPDDYTQDGTVDLKGNPVLRSKRGGWTACSFVVVYEVFERMAYYGISSNLVIYLTKKLHQGTVKSSNNVTNWVGTVWVTPLLGAYVADAHLGRYWTFVIASAIYLAGMSVLTLAVSVPGLKAPRCVDQNVENCKKASTLQLAVFYGALYTLAVGTGGTKPNISTIGADQFDDFEPKEKAQKLSFFNWWMFSIFFGTLFANTILVYIQDNVGWTLGYGLPTLGLAISVLIFLVGTPFYRHRVPSGSPFTRMAKVIVAALRKWTVPVPSDPKELYELDLEEYTKGGKFRIDSTPTLRFLNKACVQAGSTNPWMLCSVTQHPSEQKSWELQNPSGQPNRVCNDLHAHLRRAIRPILRKNSEEVDKNPRGITLLQRMGIVENGKPVPLTIFILLPQFVLMGTADAFLEWAKLEFFYDQAPESMKSLGTSYAMITLGIGIS